MMVYDDLPDNTLKLNNQPFQGYRRRGWLRLRTDHYLCMHYFTGVSFMASEGERNVDCEV